MSDPTELIRDLLKKQSLGVLATCRDNAPYTSLVGFSVSGDLREVYFATHRATRKYANLDANEHVSLLVENTLNLSEDFRNAAALTIIGNAEEVAPADLELPRQSFLAKHPMLIDFIDAPGCALIRIRVERYSLVRRFQDVLELNINDINQAN